MVQQKKKVGMKEAKIQTYKETKIKMDWNTDWKREGHAVQHVY